MSCTGRFAAALAMAVNKLGKWRIDLVHDNAAEAATPKNTSWFADRSHYPSQLDLPTIYGKVRSGRRHRRPQMIFNAIGHSHSAGQRKP
jgi:hypothetical protein